MKTKEIESKINGMIKNGDFINLKNWIITLRIYYRSQQDDGYTENLAAREFDKNGSCTNSYIRCDDGYIKCPF